MILDKVFNCVIKVRFLDNRLASKTYTIKAKDKYVAKEVCQNKFINEHLDMDFEIQSIDCSFKPLTADDSTFILNLFNTSFKEFSNLVDSKRSYLDFIEMYENFNGFNYNVDGVLSSYEVYFQGFNVRICFNGYNLSLDVSHLTYTRDSGRVYIIEDNWNQIYLG